MLIESIGQGATAATVSFDLTEGFLSKKEFTVEDARTIRRFVYQSIRIRKELEEALKGRSEEDKVGRFQAGLGLWILRRHEEALERLSGFATQPVGAWLVAETLLAMGRLREAHETLESIVSKEGISKHEASGELQLLLVRAKRELGDIEGAQKVLKTLAKSQDANALYHYELGAVADDGGEYDEARAAYQRALELKVDFSPALFRLGYGESIRGSDSRAIGFYERAIAIEPRYEEAVLNLGTLYEDTEQWEKAVRCYESILDENPAHDRARLFRKDAVDSMTMYIDEDMARRTDKHNQILQIPISDFELSVRSRNCLAKMNIRTLGDLVQKTEPELLSYKNFGETSLTEIKSLLTKRGLTLGMLRGDRESEASQATVPVEVLEKSVADLDLSIRCRNCLTQLGVQTVGDLIMKTEEELMGIRNFGQTSLNEIKTKLTELNLMLAS